MPVLDVGQQVRPGIAPHDDAFQRGGEVGETVADLKAVSLERRDAPVHAERDGGLGEVHAGTRRASAHLRTAFAEKGAEFRECRRFAPQRHPHFAAGFRLIGARRAGVADARLAHTERIDERTLVRAFEPLHRGRREEQRAFDHQDEIPRIHRGRRIETGRGIGTTSRAGEELADGSFRRQARSRIGKERRAQPTLGFRRRFTGRRVHDFGEALHEVVGELQPPIVAARAEQWGKLGAVLTEHEHRIEPVERLFGEGVAAALEQERFGVAVGLGLQVHGPQLMARRGNPVAIRRQSVAGAVLDGDQCLVVVLRKEAAASVPGREYR